jgi:antitoxin MazE7
MSTTTIKVDTAVRDRLASVARARGITMTVLLHELSLQLQAEQEWAEIEGAYARLQREDPDGWKQYLDELGTWDATTADPGDAAAEWPELN